MPVVTPEVGSGLQTLNFGNAPIRLVVRDGEPWWVAADVCAVLEISNSRDALTRLDEEERDAVVSSDTMGRPQQMNIINESGVYNLVFSSRKPEAKAFKKWITSEVIPELCLGAQVPALCLVEHQQVFAARLPAPGVRLFPPQGLGAGVP